MSQPPAGAGETRRFADDYPFGLDDFQSEAVAALAGGRSVLVAAPTGAGKTVVGEYAVWDALRHGGKCFYTTPVKALSNQKFNDLVTRYGAGRVGLLTGDRVVNGEAPVVVMTTEVLRNMLYEGSSTLVGLRAVVLDEVHFLADRERGAVWEEVIISLPDHVQLACLSATVSNAEELGAWLAQVRAGDDGNAGGCAVVVTDSRPVPLDHHYAVGDRLHPTFSAGGKGGRKASVEAVDAARQARGGTPNPEVLMLERRTGQQNRVTRRGRRVGGPKLRAPRRSDLVRQLARRGWLPAIYFVFSRAGCDDAVRHLVEAGVGLNTPQEAEQVRAVVDERTADLPADDLEVLGYGAWSAALEQGVAAHHAGLVPVFKETVEALFVRGLVKVCFATETLALGINMPARTVVVERLEKWNGRGHELLTSGQFTQLTGRAGRRGLDAVGHAVVPYQRDVDFPTVAALVARRTDPLRSPFAPSYNTAVNLLGRLERPEADALLARSFAQYQVDRSVAGDVERAAKNRDAMAGYAQRVTSDRGDAAEYARIAAALSRLESEGAKDRRTRAREELAEAVAGLREGDVVALARGGATPALAVVVERSAGPSGTALVRAVTDDRRLVRLGPRDFSAPPHPVGHLPLPARGGPRSAAYRKEVAGDLARLDPVAAPKAAGRPVTGGPAGGADPRTDPDVADRVARLRADLRDHPVHADPDREEITRWARRRADLEADTERLERGIRRRTGSLVRRLDAVVDVLTGLDYLTDDADAPRPTKHGRRLAGLYAETDLVLAETARHGALDGLDAADLAAVASVFTYTTRLKDPPAVRWPTPGVRRAADVAAQVWTDVVAREEAASLPPTRAPDAGFAEVVHRWALGADLDVALGAAQMTPGDFVRATKQVADLLRQLRDVAGADPELTGLADTARTAARSLVRGVVAYEAA